jgi:hypothetical protein
MVDDSVTLKKNSWIFKIKRGALAEKSLLFSKNTELQGVLTYNIKSDATREALSEFAKFLADGEPPSPEADISSLKQEFGVDQDAVEPHSSSRPREWTSAR